MSIAFQSWQDGEKHKLTNELCHEKSWELQFSTAVIQE